MNYRPVGAIPQIRDHIETGFPRSHFNKNSMHYDQVKFIAHRGRQVTSKINVAMYKCMPTIITITLKKGMWDAVVRRIFVVWKPRIYIFSKEFIENESPAKEVWKMTGVTVRDLSSDLVARSKTYDL